MARKKPTPKPPAFVVKLRGAAPDDLRALNGKMAKAVKDHINDLRRRGCAAAGYRLSGPPPWNKICSTHLGAIVVGRSCNGRKEWVSTEGQTFGVWETRGVSE